MNRIFPTLSIGVSLCVAMVCMAFPSAVRGEERQAEEQTVFPLLSDIPERPEEMSTDARENEKRYHDLVADLEGERSELLERVEQLRRATAMGGD